MKNYCVFIIAAEHHYIQVEQAITYYELNKENTLFWFISTNDSLWINRVIKEKEISNYEISKSWLFSDLKNKDPKIDNYINILKKIRKEQTNVKLFFNQYSSDYTLLALNYLDPSEIIFMDEGTASFSVCNIRKKIFNPDVFKLLVKSFYYKRFINFPSKITFFTQYNLVLHPKDSLVKYNFIKENNKLNFIDNVFALLGSSMVEVDLLDEEYYLELLKTIKKNYLNAKLLYFSHRKESTRKLEKIKDLGFEIINNEIPFEFYFEKMKDCPAIIGSFFSPTLSNLESKFSMIPKFIIFEFEFDKLKFNKTIVEEIYNSYRDNKNLIIKNI